MKELEEKVISYLERKEGEKISDRVEYVGLRENMEVFSGEFKDVHTFRYDASVGTGLEDQVQYIFVDSKTNKLLLLITPHFSEKIYED